VILIAVQSRVVTVQFQQLVVTAGFGNPAVTLSACSQPIGFVTDDTDCDDTDPSVNPGATEVSCNGVDDDCNPGTLDAQDQDNDGVTDCAGDCDDTDPAIYPGNPEICDGKDNDCNSVIDDGGVCCACDCHGDPANCEGLVNVFDVVACVDEAFRNGPSVIDPNVNCPASSDNDVAPVGGCNGVVNVFDVVAMVDVAFRNADPVVTFCDPCGL